MKRLVLLIGLLILGMFVLSGCTTGNAKMQYVGGKLDIPLPSCPSDYNYESFCNGSLSNPVDHPRIACSNNASPRASVTVNCGWSDRNIPSDTGIACVESTNPTTSKHKAQCVYLKNCIRN